MPLFSTASSRSTAVAATFWLVVLLGNNLSASLLIARRGRVQDLYSPNGVNSRGITYDDDNSVDKRDGRGGSGRGTCTCTCETKPVSSPSSSAEESSASSGIIQPVKPVEKFVPQTAALMRTATRPRPSSTEAKTKTTQQSQSHHQPQSHAGGRTGIISVPPMQDYGLDNAYEPSFNEQANAVEPVDESQHEQPEENEEQQGAEDNWAQERYPWKRLPDRMCFRDVCSSDRDCCRRFNLCDRSAHVCVDCWYGSTCTSEGDCCLKYPYCLRNWRTDPDGTRHVVGGKCTNEL